MELDPGAGAELDMLGTGRRDNGTKPVAQWLQQEGVMVLEEPPQFSDLQHC